MCLYRLGQEALKSDCLDAERWGPAEAGGTSPSLKEKC